jgi:hypothetical protein
MKLLSKDLLLEYGFQENKSKSNKVNLIMTKDKFDIVIKTDGTFYYSNMGFDYPIKDLSALRKLYKEVKREDLNSI